MTHHRLAAFCLTALLSFAAATSAQQDTSTVELPEMGEPADLTLSPGQEAKIGDEVAAEL